MKEAVSRKKERSTRQCVKTVLRRIRGGIKALQNCPNRMFRLVKGQKTDSKKAEGGRCMRGSDGKLCFSEKERGKFWKDYMERIMNEENDWDPNVVAEAVEGAAV